jgi:hypothetical protein
VGGLGVSIEKYNRNWKDGTWQQIIIPAVDIHQNKTACMRAQELSLRGPNGQTVNDYEVLVDDVGFYF